MMSLTPQTAPTTIKKTGRIWDLSSRVLRARVDAVCLALLEAYGEVRLGNPRESLDDLVYVMLSNRTGPETARAVFREVKAAFPLWDSLPESSMSDLLRILRPAGLSEVRARHLIGSLRQLRADFGATTLDPVVGMEQREAEAYLRSLPGVSEKVAKCVMMYTMGHQVLPVDVHVHRIASRLGWTARKRADQSHAELESLVPEPRRFAFHVDCVMHGRLICKSRKPSCTECCIRAHCAVGP